MRKGDFVTVHYGVKCPINKQGQIGRIINIEFEGAMLIFTSRVRKAKLLSWQYGSPKMDLRKILLQERLQRLYKQL